MSEHIYALNAVARDRNGMPNCSDRRLQNAEKAGLIAFKAWPSGHWQITPSGREYMNAENADDE